MWERSIVSPRSCPDDCASGCGAIGDVPWSAVELVDAWVSGSGHVLVWYSLALMVVVVQEGMGGPATMLPLRETQALEESLPDSPRLAMGASAERRATREPDPCVLWDAGRRASVKVTADARRTLTLSSTMCGNVEPSS